MTVRIIQGDARDVLKTLPDESVHCVITSPPYWGLRSYGKDAGMIGLEPTMAEWLGNLVDVFREVRRILRKDGTFWLNVGDAYATAGYRAHKFAGGNSAHPAAWNRDRRASDASNTAAGSGLRAKQRLMLPARLALALQADGWWLRDEIVWRKPNAMPLSVHDRTTPQHEMLYLFSKSARYYYDYRAIEEPAARSSIVRLSQKGIGNQNGGVKQDGFAASGDGARNGSRRPSEIVKGLAVKVGKSGNKERKLGAERGRPDSHIGGSVPWEGFTRNKRSVWDVATEATAEEHFATFPPKLIEPCILAGCPPGGTCLDPFIGTGTTALVADRLGRDCIGIELSAAYCAMADARLRADLRDVEGEPAPTHDHGPLFEARAPP